MNLVTEVRQQLKSLGLPTASYNQNTEEQAAKLTICQLIVVMLSLASIVFLFAPLLYLTNISFMFIFFAISLLLLFLGIWFWLHQAEICEHPEEVLD